MFQESVMTNHIEEAIQQATTYADAHREAYLAGFKEFLQIPSISTDPAYQPEVQRAADWVVSEMNRIGLKNCRAIPSQGHPVVYGEWLEAGEDKPTVLVYAHYDVQPVDPLELWQTPPFEPTLRDGRLYARGVVDDKVGVFVNLKAFESIFETAGRLPVNIKVFFEGEEESGSPSMAAFIAQHKELFNADLLLISDGGSRPDQPLIMSSVRGIVDGEVVVSGPRHDLHSGQFGGIVHNPLHLVGKMIAALHDESGRVQIPGFYDQVRPLTPEQREQLQAMEATASLYLQEVSGVEKFWGVSEYSLLERATAQPTCEVNGIYGGYQGRGSKTIIPASGGFKVTMRLVADQDPADIARKFSDFINSFAGQTLKIKVWTENGSWPAQLLTEGPAIEALQQAFEAVWGKRAILYRQGGSVPVIGMFQRELGLPTTTLGYGVGENIHAPNEYLILDHFYRGIDTAIHFFNYVARMK
jgi:acetylornithine deacetylase/succinyl-diaminopimelate desuccinylase-like protein